MLSLTYISEMTGQLTIVALVGQVWALPFLIYLNVVNTQQINKWVFWSVLTLLLSYPNGRSATIKPNRHTLTASQRTPSK